MIRMNAPFVSAVCHLQRRVGSLHGELEEISEEGFIRRENCFVLKSLALAGTNAKVEDFTDCTGFECFVNHIHIDDFVDDELIEQAALYIERVLSMWNKSGNERPMNAIMSWAEDGVSVRFHLCRPDEQWLMYDLEGYQEGILEISSSDVGFFAELRRDPDR